MIEIFEFDEVVFDKWWMNESWMYWVGCFIKSCLRNREHQKTQYEIQSFKKYFSMMYAWNTNLGEYEFF